eukprot:g5468.t1
MNRSTQSIVAASIAALTLTAASADVTVTQGDSAPTYSSTLNFDEVGGPTGVVSTDAWASLGISEFQAGDGVPQVGDFDAANGGWGLGDGNSFYGNFGVFITFDSDLTDFSAQVWDPSGPPGIFGGLSVIAFNDGVEVGFIHTTPAWGGVGDDWFNISATEGMVFDEVRILGFGFVAATFEIIPNVASANDMSPDGRFVVGSYDTNGDFFPDDGYRWDRLTDTFTIIPSVGTATGVDTILAVSDDGSTLVGNIPETSVQDFSHQAAIWTDEDGWEGLGWLPNADLCPSRSSGYEISGDGSVVVGLSWDGCSGRGFRWTRETGMEELQNLANGSNRASVLSGDGTVIAGFAQGAFNRTPATWDGPSLAGTLLDPPNGEIEGEFNGISDDGSIILGSWSMGELSFEAGMIVNGVPQKIGDGSMIPGWSGNPMDIADNGAIVGFDILLGARRAWIQPAGETGMFELVSYLESLGASVPEEISLEESTLRHALALLMICAGATASAGDNLVVTYQRIPGSAFSADDMSPDGRFVVGSIDADQDIVADGTYLWDRVADLFTVLPPEGLSAVAVSDDGTTVLGDMPDPVIPDPQIGVTAARWTAAGGWQSLGALPNALECPSRSNGYELSADGEVAVGLSWDGCSGRGFVWTPETGMLELEPLVSGGNRATVVSADGSVIAGFAQGISGRTPASWNADTLLGAPFDPPGATQGEYLGIRDDGSLLLGTAYMGGADGVFDAVRWTESGGMEVIGTGSIISGWAGKAMDIADNGTVVGFDNLFGNRLAWIQPLGDGPLVNLRDWAIDHGADIPANASLDVAQAISADGTVIIGHGFGATSYEGWVLTITQTCGDADLAEPYGALDFSDVLAFLTAFGDGDASADLAEPLGTFDFSDVIAFLGAFGAGCP